MSITQSERESTPIIQLDRVGYAIGETTILHDISLLIQKGEFIGLIGPNGAGKTTLLKTINGIFKAKGSIQIYGHEINDLTSRELAKSVALMQQNAPQNFPFTSYEMVMMGRYPHLRRFQPEGEEDHRIAKACMEETNTLELASQFVSTLSGGERQRVMFAKALAQQAPILLLDEPTASLDIRHQEQIFRFSHQFQEAGGTVVAAVHDLKVAARYCSRLILMHGGKILAEGSPEEVLTSEHLLKAYGVNALVYRNQMTGLLDLYLGETQKHQTHTRIHVIGGGGSASGIIRYLFERGYEVTAGVFSHGDSDLFTAELFRIPVVATEPFSAICQDCLSENIRYVEEADLTVLCSMPFGRQNLDNLQAAAYASKLVILEDDPPDARDYTGGEAMDLYRRLMEGAIVTTSARIHEVL